MTESKIPKEPGEDVKIWLLENFYVDDGTVYRSDGYIGSLSRGKYRQFKYRIGSELICTIVAHHISWYLNKGTWPEFELDHIDRNKQNNDIDNLRYGNNGVNAYNRESSGFLPTGVKLKKSGYYEAYIKIGGKKVYLGQSRDPFEAGLMYERAKKEIGR